MADIVVAIHGLANKPEVSQLAGWWKDALDEGVAKSLGVTNAPYTFEMVHWAELYTTATVPERDNETAASADRHPGHSSSPVAAFPLQPAGAGSRSLI